MVRSFRVICYCPGKLVYYSIWTLTVEEWNFIQRFDSALTIFIRKIIKVLYSRFRQCFDYFHQENSQNTVETLNKVSFLCRQCPNTIVNLINVTLIFHFAGHHTIQ